MELLAYQENYSKDFLFLMLGQRFNALCEAIHAIHKVYINSKDELIWLKSQYLSSNRHYHDIRHIFLTLELYDIIKDDIDSIEDRIAMQYALIYHDCIYSPKRGEDFNIDSSIKMALDATENLKMSNYGDYYFGSRVKDFIMATHHYKLFANIDERNNLSIEQKYISDIDLYSLSADSHLFNKNNINIRKEFSHLSDDEFNTGQLQFFNKVLSLDNIYLTKFFGKFETTARKNIENYIKYSLENNNK